VNGPCGSLFYLGRQLCRWVYGGLWHLEATGLENIPAGGPALLMSNHVSYLDPPAVGCLLPRRTHYMAKAELFDVPVFRQVLFGINAFPVRRGQADRAAFRRTLELLAAGEVVVLFPEGTRSPDGRLQPAESGAALLALRSRVPVVPVALVGPETVFPRGARFPRPGRIRVRFGRPLTFREFYGRKNSKEEIQRVGELIMSHIAELLAEERQRGRRR